MEVLLIIILIIIVAPYILRLLFPFLLKWLVKRSQPGQPKNENKKEGDIRVEIKEKPNSGKTNDLGEYIDFEEIKDK